MNDRYGENNIQMAIGQALQAWARDRRRGMQLFPPYANQQGQQLRRYCSDLLGVMEGADLIALEVKEYDLQKKVLPQFDDEQYEAACFFADQGVPLAYAYNAVEKLAYHDRPQPFEWPELTLRDVKRSLPRDLKSRHPLVNSHDSLLDWLEAQHTTDGIDLFGKTHGLLQATDDFTNGILVLLYSGKSNKVASFTGDQLKQAVSLLQGNEAYLSNEQLTKLQEVLQASEDTMLAFSLFQKPPTQSTITGPKPKP
jgi:hypothetical protein